MPIRYSILFLSALGLTAVALAQQAPATTLKTIMQELRNDAVLILDSLLVDDMAKAAEAAVRISSHPQIPPEQVSLVAAELGPEMAAFKQFDTLVHDLSVSIHEAAEDGDRSRAQKHFQDMMAGCLGCHAAYRERVTQVLAGDH